MTSTTAVTAKKRHQLGRKGRQRLYFYLFLLPAIIGFSILTAYPFFSSLSASFTNRLLYYPGDAKFIGFRNYIYLLTAFPKFWPSFQNSLIYALCSVVFTNVLALLAATALTKKLKGTKLFRTLFYIPSILPAVATVIMFAAVFDPSNGLVNSLLLKLGVARIDLPTWFASSKTALTTLILISLWGFGGKMIIYIAGLNEIPESYYEAARLDGANSFVCFFRITLPLVTPSILYNLITAIIAGMQVFTEAFVGAGSVDFYVGTIYNLAYTGTYQMGLASAMAWLLFVFVAALVFGNMALSRLYVHYDY